MGAEGKRRGDVFGEGRGAAIFLFCSGDSLPATVNVSDSTVQNAGTGVIARAGGANVTVEITTIEATEVGILLEDGPAGTTWRRA